ncbi:hypothetical protein EON65_08030 [archaeon]|nr:MAG: hypothetical protein EON65_08030 [archaeon]
MPESTVRDSNNIYQRAPATMHCIPCTTHHTHYTTPCTIHHAYCVYTIYHAPYIIRHALYTGGCDGIRAVAERLRGDVIILHAEFICQFSLAELVNLHRTSMADVTMMLAQVSCH